MEAQKDQNEEAAVRAQSKTMRAQPTGVRYVNYAQANIGDRVTYRADATSAERGAAVAESGQIYRGAMAARDLKPAMPEKPELSESTARMLEENREARRRRSQRTLSREPGERGRSRSMSSRATKSAREVNDVLKSAGRSRLIDRKSVV